MGVGVEATLLLGPCLAAVLAFLTSCSADFNALQKTRSAENTMARIAGHRVSLFHCLHRDETMPANPATIRGARPLQQANASRSELSVFEACVDFRKRHVDAERCDFNHGIEPFDNPRLG